jgi:hypothetical protein
VRARATRAGARRDALSSTRSRSTTCHHVGGSIACTLSLTCPCPTSPLPAAPLQEARKKAGKAAGVKMPVAAKHAGKGRT